MLVAFSKLIDSRMTKLSLLIKFQCRTNPVSFINSIVEICSSSWTGETCIEIPFQSAIFGRPLTFVHRWTQELVIGTRRAVSKKVTQGAPTPKQGDHDSRENDDGVAD